MWDRDFSQTKNLFIEHKKGFADNKRLKRKSQIALCYEKFKRKIILNVWKRF